MCRTLAGSHRVGCTCLGSEEQSLDPGSLRWIEEALSDPTQIGGTGCEKFHFQLVHNLDSDNYDQYDEVTFVLQ